MARKSWLAVPTIALLLGAGLAGCRVRQTEEGKIPKVDVDVKTEEGNLPKYDVEAGKVEVKTEAREVTVPTVKTEKREVKVPTDVDVTYPKDTEQKPPQ
jgi:hypothetical protein